MHIHNVFSARETDATLPEEHIIHERRTSEECVFECALGALRIVKKCMFSSRLSRRASCVFMCPSEPKICDLTDARIFIMLDRERDGDDVDGDDVDDDAPFKHFCP